MTNTENVHEGCISRKELIRVVEGMKIDPRHFMTEWGVYGAQKHNQALDDLLQRIRGEEKPRVYPMMKVNYDATVEPVSAENLYVEPRTSPPLQEENDCGFQVGPDEYCSKSRPCARHKPQEETECCECECHCKCRADCEHKHQVCEHCHKPRTEETGTYPKPCGVDGCSKKRPLTSSSAAHTRKTTQDRAEVYRQQWTPHESRTGSIGSMKRVLDYFRQKVYFDTPFRADMPRWLWDFTIYSLWFAALGMFLSVILMFADLWK